MNDFTIITDAACDLADEFLAENGVERIPMPYYLDNEEFGTAEKSLTSKEFYDRLRAGATPQTAQIKQFEAMEVFEKQLQAGKDILYLSFSSGISGSYDNSNLVKAEMLEKYPERKIITVDTLLACGTLSLMVRIAIKKKQNGETMEEIASWCEENKLRFRTLFIVDDLTLLKKGGRISKIDALMGTILGIKPALELNEKGRIVPINKCLGRKKAIKTMIDYMRSNIIFGENEYIVIGHADCLEDAKKVAEQIKQEFGNIEILIENVNPLVGSHAGPSAMGLFYIGKKREVKTLLNMMKNQEK